VIIADLRLTEDAQKIVDEDADVSFCSCDVTKWADLQRLIDVSKEEYGDTPDIYVASAGVFEPVNVTFNQLYELFVHGN
jgi:NAD(P)-dependent dehydrogenase (short-subunit alcohol dehydrogenase family)